MRFVPIGVGDAFSDRYYSSAVAIEADGRWLLVDCPHPIRKILREASISAGVPLEPQRFDAVVITHLHGDHVAGLEGLGWWSRGHGGARPRVAAHPLVLARLWEGRLAAAMDGAADGGDNGGGPMRLEDYFETAPLYEARAVQVGPFVVACRRTRHPVPTFALRITAGGRTLALSADTAYDPSLIEWLAPADLVLHETGTGIHTPYAALAALPSPLRAKMRLIHYPDELDASDGAVEPLVQGSLYDV